jgi:hypothetical protein
VSAAESAPDKEKEVIPAKADVEPGTFRYEVLVAARRFKASWVELGALLVRVRKEGLHESWGYPTFEAYCLKELHIRRQTALKLTNSYAFLEKHEREMLNQPPENRPSFEVVEVLAKAEERGQLNETEYQAIRDDIWKEDKPPAELAKELSQRFPAPPPPQPPANVQLKRFANTARRFAEELSSSRQVPDAIRERASALAEDLEELAKNHKAA